MAAPDPATLTRRLGDLPSAARLLEAVRAGSEDVYLVGGAVRDLWLGGAPLDLDLVVAGEVGPLAARLGAEIRPHERFGTATVRGPDGARYDLARARSERYPHPGALPVVAPAAIGEDLARRDFSVNALALGLNGPDAGRLRAVPQGAADLAGRRLRVLHDASFVEDPTRLLRLARYAARLGFAVEPGTEGLARAAVERGALQTVSGERIGAELGLLTAEADPVAGFAALHALGIDGAVAPGFGIADGPAAREALALLPADADRTALLLGLATAGVRDPETRRLWIAHLGLPAARRDAALAVARAGELAAALHDARRPSAIDAAIGATPVEAVAAAAALGGSEGARAWLAAERHTRLEITGADLLAAGVAAGPAIAAGLRAARAARLDGEAATREAQLAVARRAAQAAIAAQAAEAAERSG